MATLEGHEEGIFHLAVLKGGRLASGSVIRGEINIWEVETGARVATLDGGHVECLAALDCGRLASGSIDRAIRPVQ